MARVRVAHLLAVALLCAAASTASGATRLTIRGAGFGHGVGMSQYGAYGLAQNGASHREILAHYYTGTSLEKGGARTVRVLLQSRSRASFTNAAAAAGRRLNPARTYRARRGPGGTVELLSPTGRRLKRVAPPLQVRAGQRPLQLRGTSLNGRRNGTYRGTLEFRPGATGVLAINAVDIEDYLRGVVPDEMPPSWHPEALQAQAVAARTYAVTTSKAGDGWDQYPDTRSQVYGGVAAEDPRSDAAIAATAGELVTYKGEPVVTFFFSTSGGRTENVENTTLGDEPLPWLKSVSDPHDDISPRHRWGPIRMSRRAAGRKLRGLVKGAFRGIEVIDRGRSPRVIAADIIGTRGRTRVNGATLRFRLGLYDTWAYFTSISTRRDSSPDVDDPARTDSTGGSPPSGYPARRGARRLTGSVRPARRGSRATVQMRVGRRWRRAGAVGLGRRGRFSFAAPGPGLYRVTYRGAAGPAVRLR